MERLKAALSMALAFAVGACANPEQIRSAEISGPPYVVRVDYDATVGSLTRQADLATVGLYDLNPSFLALPSLRRGTAIIRIEFVYVSPTSPGANVSRFEALS